MNKKIKVYNLKAEIVSEVKMEILPIGPNVVNVLIPQYIRVYLKNQSQGTSKVKTRAEVRGGGKKPWKQKGTGRARAGTIRSPLWRGGGVIHGPSPRDVRSKLTKKMRKVVFNAVIALKLKSDGLIVLDYKTQSKKAPSTKLASLFLSKLKAKGRVLIINSGMQPLYLSFRNIKNTKVVEASTLSAYDLLSSDFVVVSSEAVDYLSKRIQK